MTDSSDKIVNLDAARGSKDDEDLPPSPDRPADEKIKLDTCIPLIDAEPKVIARRLRDRSWSDRRRFFDSILAESFTNLGKSLELFEKKLSEAELLEYSEVTLLGMHQQICATLDLWGEAIPPNEDAAVLYAVSLSPEHRRAARIFCGDSAAALDRLFKWGSGLMVFKNASRITQPGLSEIWRRDYRDKR